jgi:phosphoribosylformylglycinamidine cyclo-ligase
VPEVLEFLTRRAGLGQHEAWGVFNMGSGFAVFCGKGSGREVIEAAEAVDLTAVLAGSVEAGARRLIIEPLGVTYESDELQLS